MSKLGLFATRAHDLVLVDDDEDLLESMAMLFESRFPAATIRTFLDPIEALANIKAQVPDVVVSDYTMPAMDGLTFCAKVHDVAPSTGRILLTGHPDRAGAHAATEGAQVEAFLLKPIRPEILLDVVGAAMVRARQRLVA